MTTQEKRLVALDLLIARTKQLRKTQKTDLKKVKAYKGDAGEAAQLLKAADKTLASAKKERRGLIEKLLKAAGAAK